MKYYSMPLDTFVKTSAGAQIVFCEEMFNGVESDSDSNVIQKVDDSWIHLRSLCNLTEEELSEYKKYSLFKLCNWKAVEKERKLRFKNSKKYQDL